MRSPFSRGFTLVRGNKSAHRRITPQYRCAVDIVIGNSRIRRKNGLGFLERPRGVTRVNRHTSRDNKPVGKATHLRFMIYDCRFLDLVALNIFDADLRNILQAFYIANPKS